MDLEDILVETGIMLASTARAMRHHAHSGLVGEGREDAFRNLIAPLLPSRFGLGTGRVVGVRGQLSRQTDVVFYDVLNCPKFMTGDSKIFPSLGVNGICEVKSEIDKDELKDCVQKAEAFKKLYDDESAFKIGQTHFARQGVSPKPFSIVFAYAAGTSLSTLSENLRDFNSHIAAAHQIDLVVVNEAGIIARSFDGKTVAETQGYLIPSIPEQIAVIESGRKTLWRFYQLLSEMLLKVETFPISPILYARPTREIDDHVISGQIREIEAKSGDITSLSVSFMKMIIEWTNLTSSVNVADLEQQMFSSKMIEFRTLGTGNAWLYDPDLILEKQIETFDRAGSATLSLATFCIVVFVDDRAVLVPRAYMNEKTVDRSQRS